MLELKPVSKDLIPKALVKANHYRLLNDAWQAESICRDILQVDPNHQLVLLCLILAITDQFENEKGRTKSEEAKELCAQLNSKFEQKYYQGIISERLGITALFRNSPRVKYIAYEHLRAAMDFFEDAEKIQPKDNQDAVLRWNACIRRIKEFDLKRSPEDNSFQPFLDV